MDYRALLASVGRPLARPLHRALAVSLGVHLVASLLLANWPFVFSVERPRFAGNQQVIHMELAESTLERAELQPPVEMAVEEPVLIMPERARVLRRHFQEMPAEPVAKELLRSPVEGESEPPETLLARAPAPQEPTTEPDPATSDRPVVRRPPKLASPPVAVQVPGTDQHTPPNFVGNPPPRYPDLARRQKWEGRVLLRLFVDGQGAVTRVEIVQSSGYAILDAAAVNAVRNWKGQPGQRFGVPVASEEVLPVRFKLR